VNHDAVVFLQGVSATAAWVSGLLFLRFWRKTRDPLFGYFGVAFWVLALSWSLLALFSPTEESRPYIYALRLIAFSLIITGMVIKNVAANNQSPR
jgi:cobalamin synthase